MVIVESIILVPHDEDAVVVHVPKDRLDFRREDENNGGCCCCGVVFVVLECE